MLQGYATAEGTARYRDRFPKLRDALHFRQARHAFGVADLWLPSIGLGTYLGEPDDSADTNYIQAIVAALGSGINMLDTAINYRHQRSERNIGAALKQGIADKSIQRDEVFISTKAGYLSFDSNLPADPRAYFMHEYVEPGTLDPRQITGGMHCIAPAFLENQIQRSRRNLGLETIDLFYLHNPESQLSDVDRDAFRRRVTDAFVLLESLVTKAWIRFYGMATWNGFRTAESSREYLSLRDMVELAKTVGGTDHHFRFVQLPFSLAMPEAYTVSNQPTADGKKSFLEAASDLGIAAVGSATLSQGRLTYGLSDVIRRGLATASDAESAIQFSRSAPGMTTSLIGMGHAEHVTENIRVGIRKPADDEAWQRLFRRAS